MNMEWTWYSKMWITVSVSATTHSTLLELAGCPYFRSPSVAKENIWLIRAGCRVCHPTNSVKAPRETQSRDSIIQGESTNDERRRRRWVKSSERRKHGDIGRVLRSNLAPLVSTSGADWLLNPLVDQKCTEMDLLGRTVTFGTGPLGHYWPVSMDKEEGGTSSSSWSLFQTKVHRNNNKEERKTHAHKIQYLCIKTYIYTRYYTRAKKLKKNYEDAWLQYFLIRNNDSQMKYDCCE